MLIFMNGLYGLRAARIGTEKYILYLYKLIMFYGSRTALLVLSRGIQVYVVSTIFFFFPDRRTFIYAYHIV